MSFQFGPGQKTFNTKFYKDMIRYRLSIVNNAKNLLKHFWRNQMAFKNVGMVNSTHVRHKVIKNFGWYYRQVAPFEIRWRVIKKMFSLRKNVFYSISKKNSNQYLMTKNTAD